MGAFPHYGGRWAEWNGHFRDTVRQFIKVPADLCYAVSLQAVCFWYKVGFAAGGFDILSKVRLCLDSAMTTEAWPGVLQGTQGPFASAFAAALTGSPHIYNSAALEGDW